MLCTGFTATAGSGTDRIWCTDTRVHERSAPHQWPVPAQALPSPSPFSRLIALSLYGASPLYGPAPANGSRRAQTHGLGHTPRSCEQANSISSPARADVVDRSLWPLHRGAMCTSSPFSTVNNALAIAMRKARGRRCHPRPFQLLQTTHWLASVAWMDWRMHV